MLPTVPVSLATVAAALGTCAGICGQSLAWGYSLAGCADNLASLVMVSAFGERTTPVAGHRRYSPEGSRSSRIALRRDRLGRNGVDGSAEAFAGSLANAPALVSFWRHA